jgi:hypothetical protein
MTQQEQTTDRQRSIQALWDWFVAHKSLMADLDTMDRAEQRNVMREFENLMACYSQGLTFEVREPEPTDNYPLTDYRQLIISAEGNEDYFPEVIDLTTHAPVMEGWDVVPFRPAEGVKVNMIYGKWDLYSKNMYFTLLVNEEVTTDQIGIMVGVKDYDGTEDEDLYFAVYGLLEKILGEYDCATRIAYIDVCPEPKDPQKENFKPLTTLPQYI